MTYEDGLCDYCGKEAPDGAGVITFKVFDMRLHIKYCFGLNLAEAIKNFDEQRAALSPEEQKRLDAALDNVVAVLAAAEGDKVDKLAQEIKDDDYLVRAIRGET